MCDISTFKDAAFGIDTVTLYYFVHMMITRWLKPSVSKLTKRQETLVVMGGGGGEGYCAA